MRRHRIRTARPTGGWAPVLAVGLGLGLATGFLLGEFFAGHPPAALRRLWRRWRRGDEEQPTPAAIAEQLRVRLEQALGPDSQSIEFVPIGRNAVEVTGWVTSRPARSRALRIAREALGPDTRLVDSLLVWGEDDRVTIDLPSDEEPDTA